MRAGTDIARPYGAVRSALLVYGWIGKRRMKTMIAIKFRGNVELRLRESNLLQSPSIMKNLAFLSAFLGVVACVCASPTPEWDLTASNSTDVQVTSCAALFSRLPSKVARLLTKHLIP